MAAGETTGAEGLARFANEIADAAERAGQAVVSVDDGSRLTASGIVWSADGVIVAASHGVERDEELVVAVEGGTRYPATLVGRDSDTDIAVLKIDASVALTPVAPVDGDGVPKVGTLALALYRAGGPHLTATLGLVSGRRETETEGSPEYILTTDADLYPGASGGALVAAGTGAFLGLLNRLYGRGMGVALGAPLVARVVDDLLTHGRVPRGYLGVRTQLVDLPASLRENLGLAQTQGLLVAGVAAGSPAETAGVLLGDTLVAIAGTPVADIDDLRRHLRAGKSVTLSVVRGGARADLSATPSANGR